MKTINKNITNEIIINKSRFITKLFRVEEQKDINNYLDNINKEYHDATHICYAYILENSTKASDDKEPAGTAGLPILNVLQKNDLDYILAVVIRYFGGTKLGSNGLIRAYSSSIRLALDKTQIINLTNGYLIRITINYNQIKTINNLLNDINIKYKEYDEVITYEFEIEKDNPKIDDIKNYSLSFNIIKEIKIKKVL